LVAKHAESDREAERPIEDQLWRFPSITTFVAPKSPEEYFCKHNLDVFMKAIINRIDSTCFDVKEAKAVIRIIPSGTSCPEPVICCEHSCTEVGLVASDVKGLYASHSLGFSQAIQMAADCALHLCDSHEDIFNQSNVVVPFILCAWEGFQFVCVYLMPTRYPCAVLLSGALNLGVPSERQQLARWVIALADHCSRMGELIAVKYGKSKPALDSERSMCPPPTTRNLIAQPRRTTRSLKQGKFAPAAKRSTQPRMRGPSSKQGKLASGASRSSLSQTTQARLGHKLFASGKLLYKPIEDVAYPRALLCRLMSVFYALKRGSNLCQKSVCFPVGVVGMPLRGNDYQEELYRFILRKLKQFFMLKRQVSDYNLRCDADGNPFAPDRRSVYQVGHPIVVYPLLDSDQWQPATELVHQDEEICGQFVKLLTRVLREFIKAGVVHMDFRLYNLFYRMKGQSLVGIKVIDWDDALLVGSIIPQDLRKDFQGSPYFPHQCTIADGECHRHILGIVTSELLSVEPH